MKKIIIILLFLFIFYLLYPSKKEIKSIPEYVPSVDIINIDPIPLPSQFKDDLIGRINKKNKLIKNIIYDKINITLHSKGTYNLSGIIFYEKDKNFRMIADSILGKEIDIGSNNKIYWIWSKRMNPPSLYYGNHENIRNSRLKQMFNPEWMMEALNISELVSQNLIRYNNFVGIIEQKGKYKKLTLINPSNEIVIGHYLYDDSGKLIISCEIIEFQKINEFLIPKKIRILWIEENTSMEWDMNCYGLNFNIDSNNFKLPAISPTISLD